MATTPGLTPTPKKQSNALLWVLGLTGAALAALIVGGLMIAGFFLKNVQVRQAGDRVEVRTAVGEVTVSKEAAPETGLPIYPGAAAVESGANIELTTPRDQKVGVVAARLHSTDPLEKVDAWYRERLGPEFEREGPGSNREKARVHGISVETNDIAFVSETDDLVRVVALRKTYAGVEIALVRAGKHEAQ